MTTKYGPDNLDTNLSDTDLHHMVRRGWFPETSIPELEALRERHEALIEVRERKQTAVTALREQYKAEDKARQGALNEAYRQGTEPVRPDVTPDDERKAALEEAEAHAEAAARAVVAFVYEARAALRGSDDLPDGWEPYIRAQAQQVPPGGIGEQVLQNIAGEERALNAQIAEARRTLAAAELKLREYHPLKAWVARNANGAQGQIEPGTNFQVPEAYTPMAKPADLGVPGWMPDVYGDGGDVPDGAVREHLLPDDDAEGGVVETTDPEYLKILDRRP